MVFLLFSGLKRQLCHLVHSGICFTSNFSPLQIFSSFPRIQMSIIVCKIQHFLYFFICYPYFPRKVSSCRSIYKFVSNNSLGNFFLLINFILFRKNVNNYFKVLYQISLSLYVCTLINIHPFLIAFTVNWYMIQHFIHIWPPLLINNDLHLIMYICKIEDYLINNTLCLNNNLRYLFLICNLKLHVQVPYMPKEYLNGILIWTFFPVQLLQTLVNVNFNFNFSKLLYKRRQKSDNTKCELWIVEKFTESRNLVKIIIIMWIDNLYCHLSWFH